MFSRASQTPFKVTEYQIFTVSDLKEIWGFCLGFLLLLFCSGIFNNLKFLKIEQLKHQESN